MFIADMTPKCVFLDIEVASVPKMKGEPTHSITQIAVHDPSRPKGSRTFNAYIKPHKELFGNSFAGNYGIGNAPPRHSFSKVWPSLVKWVNEGLDGNRKVIVVMHNGFKHDWPILKTEIARVLPKTKLGLPKFWKAFDTLYLKNALHIPGDGSLTGLCHALGAKVRTAHDAAEDAKMTRGIFKRMIGEAPLKEVLVAALKEDHPISAAAAVINSFAVPQLAVFDFESTGLFPNKGEAGDNPRAVQLAGYLPAVDQVFNQYINPQMPIPRESSAVHKIFDADVKDSLPFNAVWMQFEEFLNTHMGAAANRVAVLAGHNIWGYDLKLYQAECERTGIQKRMWKSIDTLALARNQFKGISNLPRRGFFKQEYLAPLLGINIVGAHDAKSDVLACWQLLKTMSDGVPERKFNQAIISQHPVLALGQLCKDQGTFDASYYWKLYNKACDLTIDFARLQFDGITNEEFFEAKNLAALLGINVDGGDPDLYTRWRIFLILSAGVDRKAINEAFDQDDPLNAILKLCQQDSTFDRQKCLEMNKMACEMALPLAKALFPKEDEAFFQPERLAAMLGLTIDGEATLFDLKRFFLKLTCGLDATEIEATLLGDEAVKQLAAMIEQKGTFYPKKHAKQLVSIKTEPKTAKSNLYDYFSGKQALKRERQTYESANQDGNKPAGIEPPEKKSKK